MKISLIAEKIELNPKGKINCPLCKEMLVGELSGCDKCGTDYHSDCANEMLSGANCSLLGCKGHVRPIVLRDLYRAIKAMPDEDLAIKHKRDLRRALALNPEVARRWEEQNRRWEEQGYLTQLR